MDPALEPKRLRDVFREDRTLAILTTVLAGFTLAPLFVTPFLPLHDLPGNVALACLMDDAMTPGSVAAEHYRVQWLPLPYTAFYALVWATTAAFGIVWGTKIAVAVIIVLLPLGLMKLCLVLDRDPLLGLAGFALAWCHNTLWGFMAYKLGLGLLPFALASAADAERPRELLTRSGWATALALTHAQAFGTYGLFAPFVAGRRATGRQRVIIYLASIAPGVLLLLPWAVSRAIHGTSQLQPGQPLVEFDDFLYQLDRVETYSTVALPGEWAFWSGNLAFVAIICLPVFAIVRWRESRRDPHWLPLLVVFGLATLLYFATPMAIAWPFSQWYIYPRFAVVMLMAAAVVPAGSFRRGWFLALVPVAVAIAGIGVATTQRFADFGRRARAFLPVIEATTPSPRLLPVTVHDSDPAIPLDPYNQFHSYIVAARGGYDPLLFDNANVPVVHRSEATLPHTGWRETARTRLDLHGRHYSHILVQGRRRDPLPRQRVPPDMGLEVVIESGRWRLYRVHVLGDGTSP